SGGSNAYPVWKDGLWTSLLVRSDFGMFISFHIPKCDRLLFCPTATSRERDAQQRYYHNQDLL
ncbi:MAG: hypothetical protein L0Y55_15810, partial [Anaerolineales bacterium]|nr:hypothetical protein [Anaerolineales bacterium]